MGRPRKTINAAVFATAIRVDAGFETDIGTLIACDDGLGRVTKILGRAARREVLRLAMLAREESEPIDRRSKLKLLAVL